jgi:hypothetical protein
VLAPHICPSTHAVQMPPPQSTSVSSPFFTASAQLGAAQTPAVHTLLWQSAAPAHSLPVPQSAGQVPPQSTSVSIPFFTMSLQVGAAQRPAVHTPLTQSPPSPHVLPTAQSAGQVPAAVDVRLRPVLHHVAARRAPRRGPPCTRRS